MKVILFLGIALLGGVLADSRTYEAQVSNGATISVTNNLGSITVASYSGSTVRFVVDSTGSFDDVTIQYTAGPTLYSLSIDSTQYGSSTRQSHSFGFVALLASLLVLAFGNFRTSLIVSSLFFATVLVIDAQTQETINVTIQTPEGLQLEDFILQAPIGIVNCPSSLNICSFATCLNLTRLAYAAVPDGYCAHTFASGLSSPRSIIYITTNQLLVLENGKSAITAIWDDDNDGISNNTERAILATAPDLNHGLLYYDDYLYASSPSTVYRWPYSIGQRTSLSGRQTVVSGIPTGGHSTRSLVMDDLHRLYVQVGSASNVDSDASRSGILRFNMSDWNGVAFNFNSDGEIFALGMRNEVGLKIDQSGVLWGVENGVDNLSRPPWGDIHNNNPAEELNRFGQLDTVEANKFYGYPYCFSEYNITVAPYGGGMGTQWAHPSFMNDGKHNDTWCKDTSNVVPPALAMPAHVAPLDIIFYYGSEFPGVTPGDAFVSWHGSWNRDPPQGYKVVHVKFEGGNPVSWEPFFYYDQGADKGSNWPHKPVGLATGRCAGKACLFVSSDATGIIASVVAK